MGNYITVSGCAVEVGKNKGHVVVGKHFHIPAGSLVLSAQHIEKLHFHHILHKLGGFRRKSIVHLLPCCQDFLRCSDGGRISLLEKYPFIIVIELIQSKTLSSSLMKLLNKGYQIPFYLLTEGCNLPFPVAVSIHSGIADFREIRIPHHLPLLGTILYQGIIDRVQLLPIVLKKLGIGLPCLFTHLSILCRKVGCHERKIQILSLPGNLCRSQKLTVFGGQFIFLLHQGNQRNVYRLLRQLHVFKGYMPKLFFHIGSMGRMVNPHLVVH